MIPGSNDRLLLVISNSGVLNSKAVACGIASSVSRRSFTALLAGCIVASGYLDHLETPATSFGDLFVMH